jgi:hypothetical protein
MPQIWRVSVEGMKEKRAPTMGGVLFSFYHVTVKRESCTALDETG